jgi:hypothetical protein
MRHDSMLLLVMVQHRHITTATHICCCPQRLTQQPTTQRIKTFTMHLLPRHRNDACRHSNAVTLPALCTRLHCPSHSLDPRLLMHTQATHMGSPSAQWSPQASARHPGHNDAATGVQIAPTQHGFHTLSPHRNMMGMTTDTVGSCNACSPTPGNTTRGASCPGTRTHTLPLTSPHAAST